MFILIVNLKINSSTNLEKGSTNLSKMPKLLIICYTILILFCSAIGLSQDTNDTIYEGIHLDSNIVQAKKLGFDVNAFIRMVKNDKTFYQAFKNLRKASYDFNPDIKMYDKRDKSIASYRSQARQSYGAPCRTMLETDIEATGNFIEKNKSWHYYTSKMYQRLFMTYGKICESEQEDKSGKMSKMDTYISELKMLIFNPGQPSSIPFIGNKTAIFDKKMMPYYDYKIEIKTYKEGQKCYVFTVEAKPQYKQTDEVVIQFLQTYFDVKNLQIVGRIYDLYYDNMFYDFDVHMDIQLQQIKSIYYPIKIRYDGIWDIPFKKPEKCLFTTSFKILNQ